MTQTKRSGRKSAAKKLLMSSLLFLSLGAGSSHAEVTTTYSITDFTPIGSFGGHSYYRTPVVANWADCETMAVQIGGHLVNVGSVEENSFLTHNATVPMAAWIGYFKGKDGIWSWSDGVVNANNYEFWGTIEQTPQPDNHLGVQGAALIHSGGITPDSAWDDGDPVNVTIYGIVEVPCVNTGSISAATPSITLGYGAQTDLLTVNADMANASSYVWTINRPDGTVTTVTTANNSYTLDPKTLSGLYKINVFVSNPFGCTASLNQNILVSDVREFDNTGKLTGKVLICHTESNTPMTKSVAAAAVPAHLAHGDYLGACTNGKRVVSTTSEVKVYPNPTQNTFFVEVPQTEEVATVTLLDIQGKVLGAQKLNANDNRSVRFNMENSPRGIYVIEVSYGEQRFRSKIALQ